jgi:hypothetical protein
MHTKWQLFGRSCLWVRLIRCLLAGVPWPGYGDRRAAARSAIISLLTALGCLNCCAQGDLLFANHGNGANVPDYLCDSMTKLSGPQYMAELMAGPTATNLTSIATTSFGTGSFSGYFNGGVVTIPWYLGYPPNPSCYCFVQINIWNTNAGPNFEAAKASGRVNAWAQSAVSLTGPLGGIGCLVNPAPPPPPNGLTSLSLNGPNSPPQIGIALTSTNTLQLYWPVGVGSFIVEQNHDLALTYWTILTNTPTVISTTNLISIPQPTQPTFYRLISQ